MTDPPFTTEKPVIELVRTGQSRRRPRAQKRMSTLARYEILLLMVAAGVGAALSHGAPTGNGILDLLERAVFAALMVLAGSRARRWAFVIGAVIVSIASRGDAILFGLAALAFSAFLIAPNRRDRLGGSICGGLVAIGALHLHVGWGGGAPTVIGIIACSGIVYSGWTRTPLEIRRRMRIVGLSVLGAAASMAILAVIAVLRSQGDLTDGATSTQNGVDALRAGKPKEATKEFAEASASFAKARDQVSIFFLLPARAVPVLNQNLSAVRDVAAIGVDLTRAATASAATVDYDKIRRADGGIDLDVVKSFGKPVGSTARSLRSARIRLEKTTTRYLLPPLASRLTDFSTKVRQLGREADMAELAVAKAPALLGSGGPRRYLVLLGNPSEARDLGGHIGNWAELLVDKGHITLVEVGSPGELADPTNSGMSNTKSYPVSLTEMRPSEFPQNWGSTPDMPTAARLSAELFQHKTGKAIDGVMYADPQAFAAFVGLSGSVPVPGLQRFSLTARNAAQFVTTDQFRLFPDDNTANQSLTAVIRTVFDRLTHIRLPSPRSLGAAFSPLAHQGRFQFASLHAEDGELLTRVHLRGEVPSPSGGDLFGVLSRNANPSKIDAFLHRQTKVAINWNPITGEVGSTVTVRLRNDAPVTGMTPTVIGNRLGAPSGTNVTDLAILTPFELLRASIDGVPAASKPQWDGRYWRHEVRVLLEAGRFHDIRFELQGVVRPGARYAFQFVGQPLVNLDALSLSIVPTTGRVLTFGKMTANGFGAHTTIEGSEDRKAEFTVVPR